MQKFIGNLIKQFQEARNAAIARGIDANTVVINSRLRYVKPFTLIFDPQHYVSEFPPMILGMELDCGELPQDASFVILKTPKSRREIFKEEIRKEAIKETLEALITEPVYVYNENDSAGETAEKILSSIDKWAKDYAERNGIKWEELNI